VVFYKKETTNREASSEDTKSQQQASTLEAPQKPQNKSLIKPNNQTPNKKDAAPYGGYFSGLFAFREKIF
jgi:hypothetical protein